jgi:hypothetical protein
LEPFKEIVDVENYFFFKGKAKFKCHGLLKKEASSNGRLDFFSHRLYYDVEISNVVQFTQEQFKKWPKKFQLSKIKDNLVVIERNADFFQLSTDILYVHKEIYPNHSQRIDDELHSDFVDIPIVFRLLKIVQEERCIPNVRTGNIEFREDGRYLEITSGKFCEDKVTCETFWVKEAPQSPGRPKLPGQGSPDSPSDPYPIETPSSSVKENGCLNGGCNNGGCSNILSLIFALGWAFLCIKWAIQASSYLPILFGLGIPLLLFGIISIGSYLQRISYVLRIFFKWIFNILAILAIYSVINSLIHFNQSWVKNRNEIDSSWNSQNVEDVPPDRNDTGTKDSSNNSKNQKRITLKWKDFTGSRNRISFNLYTSDIRKSNNNLFRLNGSSINKYGQIYHSVYIHDKNLISDLFLKLDSLKEANHLNKKEFAQSIVTMVQSIPYVLILDRDCSDPLNLRNNQIRELFQSGVDCEGNLPFGITTPLEFLSSLKGDCDSRTLLLYTILKHYHYKVAILNSDTYGHSMLGLYLPNIQGSYLYGSGMKYYFWETTDYGHQIGQIQRSVGDIRNWKIELN